MCTKDAPNVAHLTTAEKILLVEDLWDSIASDESSVPVPQSHKDELDRRLNAHTSNPGNLLSLNELRAGIGKRK
jgi:putative addiction module component (TIGR02574 family)